MRRKSKKTMYVALAALVLMISVGYALLSANLRINGTSRIDDVTWDVHFENAEATANSTVTPTTAPSAPAASKLQTISYDVTFNEPGQIYEFTVDVVNGGTIDAMIESYTSKIKIGDNEEQDVSASTLPSYLDYSVTYSDGTAIQNNHLLAASGSEKIKVRVEFKRDITNDELTAAANKTITLNVGINYKQADENAVESHPQTTNFVVSYIVMHIGQAIPQEVNVRNSAIEAMADWADITGIANDTRPFYLKHTLNSNNEITESYVEFVVTEEMAQANEGMVAGTYYLKGGDSGASFTENMNQIKTAFDYANHPDRCGGNQTSDFNCYVSGLFTNLGNSLEVMVYDNDGLYCSVNNDGSSNCNGM